MGVRVSKVANLQVEIARSRSIKNLQAEIARSRYSQAPPVDWVELVEEYRAEGNGAPAMSRSHWVDGNGQAHSMDPLDSARRFEALRTTMRTDPNRGKWLATKLVVRPNGRYRYEFDYRAAPTSGSRGAMSALEQVSRR